MRKVCWMVAVLLLFQMMTLSAAAEQPDINAQNAGKALQDFANMLAQSNEVMEQPVKEGSITVDGTQLPQPAGKEGQIYIEEIVFEGADGLDVAWLGIITGEYTHREDTVKDLQGLAAKITEQLKSEGLVTARVEIPPQKIGADKTLRIKILPGRYGEVKVNNQSRLREGVLEARIGNGIGPGKLIYKQDLDRAVLRINDIAGAAAKMLLTASGTAGVFDLAVNITADGTPAIAGNVFINNYGNSTTGQYQGMLNFAWNNPARYGDSLGVAIMGGVNNQFQDGINSGALSYSIPDGWLGGNVNVAASYVRYTLMGNFSPLDANGNTTSGAINYRWPIIRGRTGNLNLDAGINYKYMVDTMAPQFRADDRRSALEGLIGIDGDFYDAGLGGGYNSYGINVNVGNMSCYSTDKQRYYELNGQLGAYVYGTANFQTYRYIGERLQWYISGNAQVTANNLNSADKLSLGGPYAVRAYTPGYASGDQGAMGTTELRYALAYPWEQKLGTLQPYVFVDGGYVNYQHSPPSPQYNNAIALGAIGGGVSLTQSGNYGAKVDIARVMPGAPVDPDGSISRVWFRLYKLF